MDMFNILNEMEEIVEESFKIPFTGKVLVNGDRILECLDRIRTSLPDEIRQAKWVLQEREKVISESKKEAARIVEDGQRQVDKRAEENEVVRQAKVIADEVVQRAQQVAQDIRQGARDYADDVLSKIEDDLDKLIGEIRNGRSELKDLKI